jgi:hypothetical protein
VIFGSDLSVFLNRELVKLYCRLGVDGFVFGVVSCAVPAGTDLSKFPVGTSVKMHRHRIAGELRLEYLKSEHAVLEIGR